MVLDKEIVDIKLEDNKTNIGYITSYNKELNTKEIRNIPYTLKLQNRLLAICITSLILLFIIINPNTKKHLINIFNKSNGLIKKYNFAPENNIVFKDSLHLMNFKNIFDLKISSIIFYIYIFCICCFISSWSKLISITGDDWGKGSVGEGFYQPYIILGEFWERGRHFVSILVDFSMRPFGEILVSYGFSPINVGEFFISILQPIFFMIFFLSLSIFTWLLNHKNNFKLIFTTISASFIFIMPNFIDYVGAAAYIGSAGISLSIFLAVFYYFLYEKDLFVYKGIHFAWFFFAAYAACFTTETSSLPIFGLSIFMLLYYISNKIFKFNDKTILSPFSIYGLILFIILVPISFLLTLFSGRGKWQVDVVSETSIIENIVRNFTLLNSLSKYIAIFGLIYAIFIIVKSINTKQIDKRVYVSLSTIYVGIIGLIGFLGININIYCSSFVIMLIFCILLNLVLKIANNQNVFCKFSANFLIISLIVCGTLKYIERYESHFNKYYVFKNSQRNLIKLFTDADNEGKSILKITKDEVERYNLSILGLSNTPEKYPNGHISEWMKKYGHTKNLIKLQIIND